jgi:Fe-S cluster assembly iron-binding protein IscA
MQEQPDILFGPGSARSIKILLAEKGASGVVRIEIRSTGCCDASLGLRVDSVRESDIVQEEEGVTFVVDRETHNLVGQITISCAEGPGRTGFIITSSTPLNEWTGFGTCDLIV